MTLLDVDVARLKCVAFDKIYNHISCFSFSEDCCSTEAKQALAATLYQSSCTLTTDVACSIEELSNTERTLCTPTSTPCGAQITITATSTPTTCTYAVGIQNLINQSSKASLTLAPNAIYHKGNINVLTTSKCGNTAPTLIQTGCYPVGSCIQAYDIHAQSYFKLAVGTQTTGYLSSIKLFTTDANGAGPLTPLTLNIAPSNLSAWTACGSCEAITSTDLQFGALFFSVAFTKLLKNISRTLYGDVFIDPLITKIDSGTPAYNVSIGTRAKHQPTTRWMGINPDSSQIAWVNNAGVTTNVIHVPRTGVLIQPLGGLMGSNYTLTTSCGTITGAVQSNNLDFPLNVGTSNIHSLVYDSLLSNNAPLLTYSVPSVTCTQTTLVATVVADQNVISQQWYDEFDSLLSSTNTVTVGPGDYYFRTEVASGCVEEYYTTVL